MSNIVELKLGLINAIGVGLLIHFIVEYIKIKSFVSYEEASNKIYIPKHAMKIAVFIILVLIMSFVIVSGKGKLVLGGVLIGAGIWALYIKSKKSKDNYYYTQSYYKIYKYLSVQLGTGARSEDVLKSLYKVVDYKSFKQILFQFSVIISQSHDVSKALEHLKISINNDDGRIFVSIIESISVSGGNHEIFSRLDHLLFQKYLSNIRSNSKKIKRMYFYTVMLLSTIVTLMLIMPLIHQMFISTKIIFN